MAGHHKWSEIKRKTSMTNQNNIPELPPPSLWDKMMIILFTTGIGVMMFEFLCLLTLLYMYLTGGR